jgi:hypothetical protein
MKSLYTHLYTPGVQIAFQTIQGVLVIAGVVVLGSGFINAEPDTLSQTLGQLSEVASLFQ